MKKKKNKTHEVKIMDFKLQQEKKMQIWLVDLSKNIWRNYIEPTSNSRNRSIVGLVLELICVTYNMKNIWKSTRRKKKKDFLKYTQDKKT